MKSAKLRNQFGRSAEDQASNAYAASGFHPIARRFRRREGEIDLICTRDDLIVFVEVKARATHDQAAEAASRTDPTRLANAAFRFMQDREIPLSTEMRFDAFLVDYAGQNRIIENAWAA